MTSRPLATYRLQFSSNFGFRDAIGILDYLRGLGISHVYASPILTSRRGSGHGYDVTDPTRIDPDLGGEETFIAFREALDARGMGLLLDIVPNHMAASSENHWWMDVLEFGPESPFASYFDVNWRPPSRDLENKILLPFLDKPFGEALDAGEFQIEFDDGSFRLRFGEQIFPIAPESYASILRYAEVDLRDAVESDSPAAHEWRGIAAAAEALASDRTPGAQAAAERRTKFDRVRERLRQLLAASPEIAAFLEAALRSVNGVAGDPRSFFGLERILAAQHYRLAFWQTASDAINYRRFFSITDLVGVRVEDPSVFAATHEPIIRLAFDPHSTGLRIDHIDGLRDPRGYLNRLRELLAQRDPDHAAGYLVVEKILERHESLPSDWPIDGTTGYDYLNFANRLLVDERRIATLVDFYSRWTGAQSNFDDIVYQKKRFVMRVLLAVEMRALGRALAELASDDRYAREFDPAALTDALIEVTACLGVYRTYIQTLDVPEADRKALSGAIAAARVRGPSVPSVCFDFLSDVLLLAAPQHVRPDQREARLAFVTRWQQFTGSIMAKGFEDTALYVYFPLASLNEVGGDPRGIDCDPLSFHAFVAQRQAAWPHSMNATTTHDTKRSEDTRARIAVLSEIPEDWERAMREWSASNERHVARVDGRHVPDRNEEYLFYQTLIGTWPLAEADWPSLVPRLQDYLVKATREAKVHTRWSRPNPPHEAALRDFVAAVLDRRENSAFCVAFDAFQQRTALYGMLNGLAQTVLRVACPGVPDCYQGSELWDFRLVDPDNRGPIDFSARVAALDSLLGAPDRDCARHAQALLASWPDGRVKLHVLARVLNARRRNADLFSVGGYHPLELHGEHRERAIAFARSHEFSWAVVAFPRCVASVAAPVIGEGRRKFWQDTALTLPPNAPSNWINALAGRDAAAISSVNGRLSLGDAFDAFPVALLLPA
ncbi:MAG TPA: malto-oligosyltrehalose synthase [Candidatus Limnocylindrales bacterium]|nr:malto-oligosyltrehalose synthase [Candidatus Limnocylindrales bacterium]